jgi:hypothetical protein
MWSPPSRYPSFSGSGFAQEDVAQEEKASRKRAAPAALATERPPPLVGVDTSFAASPLLHAAMEATEHTFESRLRVVSHLLARVAPPTTPVGNAPVRLCVLRVEPVYGRLQPSDGWLLEASLAAQAARGSKGGSAPLLVSVSLTTPPQDKETARCVRLKACCACASGREALAEAVAVCANEVLKSVTLRPCGLRV